MQERRVKSDETRVGVDCLRFLTRKNIGKNKAIHGMTIYKKKCEIM